MKLNRLMDSFYFSSPKYTTFSAVLKALSFGFLFYFVFLFTKKSGPAEKLIFPFSRCPSSRRA